MSVTFRQLLAALSALLLPPLAHAADPAPAPKRDGAVFAYVTREDGTQVKAPLFDASSDALPVARAGEEVISLQDLLIALGGAHSQHGGEERGGKKDFRPMLERMIDARLIVQEATAMGIADLSEIKENVEKYKETALREALQREAVKDAKPDRKVLEKAVREAIKEWKLKSVLVDKESDAKELVNAAKAGKKFDDLAKALVDAKKAKGGEAAAFFSREQLLPAIATSLAKAERGSVVGPVRAQDGWAVMHVEDVAYPEKPKLRAEAEAKALSAARKAALERYYAGLVKKYVKKDEPLIKKLDFEAKKPGLAALKKDQRVVARVQGGTPITVALLGAEIEKPFYHGIENAIREKKVNRMKGAALDALISQQLVPLEARRLKLETTPTYLKIIEHYRSSVLFTQFVEKAVIPDVKVTDDDCKKYFESHRSDFTYPAFYKLESIGFDAEKDAQAALKKLQAGTDLKWLRANSDGQVKDGLADVQFNGGTVSANALPSPLRPILASAKKGDWRIFKSERDQFHVVHALEITPPEQRPFDQVKDEVKDKLLAMRVEATVKDWVAKIRQARPVKIYLTNIGS
jgi:hypothetical protein